MNVLEKKRVKCSQNEPLYTNIGKIIGIFIGKNWKYKSI